MELLIFITLLIVVYLLAGLRSGQKEATEKTYQEIADLKKEILALKEPGFSPPEKDTAAKATDEDVMQWRPYQPPPQSPGQPAPKPAPETPDATAQPSPAANLEQLKEEMKEERWMPTAPQAETESWWTKWVRNNPDLEKFVGENLVNKIGITVLVLGIAFFVKYAIDQNWITETGRVCIGIACGLILTGIAHYLRNSYRSFSSVMAGGGIAVFYFTIAFAFHEYQLFSQPVAFIIMVCITVFAVMLSLLYNKIELAVIAVIGGFLAPFLVSNGSGNFVVLFSYLLILNIGILIIAYFKKWSLLFSISFFFTWIIFGGWLIKSYLSGSDALPYKAALLFATAFYFVFLITALINNLRTKHPFKAFDFSLLLLITFSYYAQGMISLGEWNSGAYQGIFTAALGLINLCLAWYLFKTQKGDKNLLYLLIGLTLTFISLAAPVQLHGHTITLFWSAECVLLYWLHQRSGINIFKYSSALILFLMLASLSIDWNMANQKNNTYLGVIYINWKGFITNIVAIISLGIYTILLKKATPGSSYVLGISIRTAGQVMATMAILVLYLTCLFGVNLYFDDLASIELPNAWHQLISYLFVAAFLLRLSRINISQKTQVSIFLLAGCFSFYLVSINYSVDLIDNIITGKYFALHALVHWLAMATLLYLFFILVKDLRANLRESQNLASWIISFALLVLFSVELKNIYVSLLAEPGSIDFYSEQYGKAGLTIVWALFSFCLIWLGMKYKYKTLRIISLTIFSIALVKLFMFDIRTISAGGKIAAFIMLGILLLVISFMYQRLKKIIISDGEKNS